MKAHHLSSSNRKSNNSARNSRRNLLGSDVSTSRKRWIYANNVDADLVASGDVSAQMDREDEHIIDWLQDSLDMYSSELSERHLAPQTKLAAKSSKISDLVSNHHIPRDEIRTPGRKKIGRNAGVDESFAAIPHSSSSPPITTPNMLTNTLAVTHTTRKHLAEAVIRADGR